MFNEGLKTKILVLFANAYEMVNEDKEKMSGCSVHYMFWGENGEQMIPQSEWDASKPVGIQRAKCSLDKEIRVKIPIAPAIYEGTFEMSVGGDGKPVMKLKDVAYFSDVQMTERVVSGLEVPGMVKREEAKAGK